MRSYISDQIDKSPQTEGLTKEQKQNAVDMQMKIGTYSRFAVPIFVFVSFFIGGLLYWLGAKAFGGTGGFMQNVSVWVYSGFPPLVIGMIANFIVMVFKSADDIDLARQSARIDPRESRIFCRQGAPCYRDVSKHV